MKSYPPMPRHPIVTTALAGAALLSLSGCEREPTPKMSVADASLASPTSTAQADTGTALGTGSLANPPVEALTRDNPSAAGLPTATSPQATSTTAGTLNGAEQRFISQVGAQSLFEIQVSELAAEKARDPALRSYAALVAADHKGAAEELRRLAAGHGVSLPETLLPQDQKTLSALRNASGTAFDKQYLQTVGVNEHEKTIATFEKASADAQNPAVKDYVQSTLPTLKSHLDAARKLQTKG